MSSAGFLLPLSAEESTPPAIAWPTLLLCAGATGAYGLVSWAWLRGMVGDVAAVVALALCTYVQFTVMHDSAHGAVASSRSGVKWVNEVTGRVAAFFHAGVFGAFRRLHLLHHRHVNDPDNDPDFWSGGSSGWPLTLPFRWVTQDFYYYAFYFQRALRRGLPAWEVAETFVTMGAILGGLAWAFSSSLHHEALVLVVFPTRLAYLLLACFFDFVPHAPHKERTDPFVATTMTTLTGDRWEVLAPFLLGQQLHHVHHMWPWLPWYHYARVWESHRDEFFARGQVVRPLLPFGPAPSSGRAYRWWTEHDEDTADSQGEAQGNGGTHEGEDPAASGATQAPSRASSTARRRARRG